jgi:hypothetical protein
MANKEWKLPVNVARTAPANVMGFDRFPTGVYVGKITGSEQDAAKTAGKKDNIIFDVECTEVGHQGKTAKLWMSTDLEDPFVKGLWKSLLVTVAKDPTKLEAGVVNIAHTMFLGKTCYFFVREAPEGAKDSTTGKRQYDNRNFVTKEMYDEYKAKHVAGSGNGVASSSNGSMKVEGGAGGATPPSAPERVELE